MEVSLSSEAAIRAAAQEITNILLPQQVHYRIHNIPPLVPILSQINPIYTILFCLSKIDFNIIHPPTSWSSEWSLSFWLSH
jgi:hypothetical protein